MEENNPKQILKLVSVLKELESSGTCENKCLSAQEWIDLFTHLLYNNYMESCSELESFIGNMSATNTFSNLDYRITQKEIKSCILKLKPGKAVGMDRISAERIKASVDQLLPVYDKLFNSIFRQGFTQPTGKRVLVYPYLSQVHIKTPLIIEALPLTVL